MHRPSQSKRCCCVPGCCEKLGSMFLFPKDTVLRDKWRTACKVQRAVSNFMVVCSKHFAASDIEVSTSGMYKRVKTGAVPSQLLPVAVRRKGRHNCVVHGCNKSPDQGVSLHFFPKDASLRVLWAAACRIVGTPSRNCRICSDHFRSSDFTCRGNQVRVLKSGVIPSLRLPTAFSDHRTHVTSKHWAVINPCCSALPQDGNNDGEHYEEVDEELEESSYAEQSGDDCADCEVAQLDPHSARVGDVLNEMLPSNIDFGALAVVLHLMKQFVKSHWASAQEKPPIRLSDFVLSSNISALPREKCDAITGNHATVLNLLTDNSQITMLTGISLAELDCLAHLLFKVSPASEDGGLCLKSKVALTLCKLHMNFSFECLSLLFCVSRPECVDNFCSTIRLLAVICRPLLYFPSREENLSRMPNGFVNFKDTRIVLDCLEIGISTPQCSKCLGQMYSHYNYSPALKSVIGLAPSGFITFLTKCYGGEAADHKVLTESGLLHNMMLPSEDAVMVCSGLEIDDYCKQYEIRLHKPPFARRNYKKAVAALGAKTALPSVHVQRAVQRMKTFKILSENLSWAAASSIDDILTVVAALVNLNSMAHEPLVSGKDCGC